MIDTENDTGARGGPRWGQERRLAFVDFRLQFERKVNRGDLVKFFSISPTQASQDMARYAEMAPDNARYDLKSKAFVAGKEFKPLFGEAQAGTFLNELLAVHMGIAQRDTSFIGWEPDVGFVPSLARPVDTNLLTTLMVQMRLRESAKIRYQAMNSAEPTVRVISPFGLGFDGFRWHVRGYCRLRNDWRDFVLGRILEVVADPTPGSDGLDDRLWHLMVNIELEPNPILEEGQRRVTELDYGMTDGRISTQCRQPLLYYALKRLGLIDAADAEKPTQHLVLVNRQEVEAAKNLKA